MNTGQQESEVTSTFLRHQCGTWKTQLHFFSVAANLDDYHELEV